MRRFFEKHIDTFDEDDALKHIKRRLDGYAQGSGGGSSSSNRSSYHENPDIVFKELAGLVEMIEDFFVEKGVDPRTYMDSYRRGGGDGRR